MGQKLTKGERELVNEWATKGISDKAPATVSRIRSSLHAKGLLLPTGAPTPLCYELAKG